MLLPFSLQATCCEFTANTTSFILLIVRNVCARPVEHADLVTVAASPCASEEPAAVTKPLGGFLLVLYIKEKLRASEYDSRAVAYLMAE